MHFVVIDSNLTGDIKTIEEKYKCIWTQYKVYALLLVIVQWWTDGDQLKHFNILTLFSYYIVPVWGKLPYWWL